MTGWKRSLRLSARLTRWINTLRAILNYWSWPYRRLHEARLTGPFARRTPRPPVRLRVEGLEVRELLSTNAIEPATTALMDDMARFRNDMATSANALVNAAQPSQTNPPTLLSAANQWNKAWNVLTQDWQQTQQAVAQFESAILGAYQQAFDTLLDDVDGYLSGQASSLSTSATGSGAGSGSMGSGHGSSGNQTGNVFLSSKGSGSGSNGIGPNIRTSPHLGSGTGSGSGPSAITITNPGNQTDAEGDSVSLQIQAGGGRGALYYGASGLPAGLTIDSNTGLISGALDYSDAETQGGQYSVTVTADDGSGDSGSTTFNWTVTNTDTLPTLDNPGNQTDWQGDAVALQLSASDPDGDNLSYSATGLPGGLALNSATGLISGVLAAPDAASSPYSVTVSAYDGSNTVSQSFTWTVTTVQIDPIADQDNLIGDNVSVPVNAYSQSGASLSYSATGLPPGVSINSSTGLITGTIASNASVTTPYDVTVTASDGTDSASTSFAWDISNFTLDNPGDQTNAEGDAVALQLTTESNGNPSLTYSATGLPNGLSINPNTGLIAGTIANLDSNNSPYSVTVSATDGTSTSSQTFTWTITHVVLADPGDQINAPGNTVSLPIQASDPDGDTLSYTATGLPQGLSINPTTGLISGTIASTAGSDTPYSVTVTASDGTHTASDTFSWTVANQAVTVTNPGNQNNAEGNNVSLPISATDPSGNALSYSAVGLPAGLQIDYASGLISGTIANGDANTNGGVYQVTVLADDGQGNNGSTTFTWNVSHTNTAPTLDNPGDQADQTGDVVSLPLFGYDDDGDTVTFSVTGLPPGLSINATTGIISGTLPASAASSLPYSVTVTASDGTLTTNQTFNWFVTANVVTLTNPGDQTNTEGDNVSLQLSASDANNSALSYQASGLPPGLSINSSTGLISGAITSGDAANAPYTVTITATDTQGYSSGQQFTWNVNPANLNPVVTNPGSQINTQGDVLSLQIQATDPPGNGLTYSATGLPPGLSINPSSGLISGVLSSNSASGSPYTVTVTATDGSYSGNTTFTWSVTNQAVTVTNPGTQSGTGGQPASLQINASDPYGYALTYAATGLPPGLSINAGTGQISGTIATSAGGAYTVTVMAGDNYGNSGSTVFTWNVAYLNQAPTLENPGDQTNKPGDIVSLQLSGSDVDGDTLSYSVTGLPSGLSVDPSSGIISGTLPESAAASTPYSVTATVSDGTYTANQTFDWYVTGGVVTLTNPGDQTNREGDTVTLQVSATDSNNLALTYDASGLPAGLSITSDTGVISGKVASGASANSPYNVTVSATDTLGYSSYQQFTWTIHAPTNALTLTNPGNQSNAEGDDVSLQLQASDPDGDTLEYAASGLPIGLTIDPTTGLISGTVDYNAAEISGGQYNVTVTVNDGNGQTVSQSFVWTITNTPQAPWLEPPDFQDNQTGTSASMQLVGGSPDEDALSYSATGLPSGLSVDSSTGLISGAITASAGSYTVTATVTDTTNNLSASQSFTWQVTSGNAPRVLISFDGQPAGEDFVDGVDPATQVPVLVTLEDATPGLHTITLSIPSGESTLSLSTFQLSDGGSETVEMTPVKVSQSFDDSYLAAYVDGQEAGDPWFTNVKVTIAGAQNGGHIRAKDTPEEMKVDRIPPANINANNTEPYTKVAVTITPNLKDEKVIVFIIDNANFNINNGTAYLLSRGDKPLERVWSQDSGNVYVVGGSQTDAPIDGVSNAGNLSIVAFPGTKGNDDIAQVEQYIMKPLAKSAGFSVAAIPINFTDEYLDRRNIPEGLTGIRVKDSWKSDSGDIRDLDNVQIREVVVQVDATGIFNGKKIQAKKSDYLMATRFSADWQVIGKNLVAAPGGDLIYKQLSIFKDARTGAVDIPMTHSGFVLDFHVAEGDKKGQWRLLVAKIGSPVTVKDPKTEKTFTSQAGYTKPPEGIGELAE